MHDMTSSIKKEKETYIFGWQEKLFCQREIRLYSNESTCTDVLERRYHHDVLALSKTGPPTTRLFSYVDHDNFTNTEKINSKTTTSLDEAPTYLADKMAAVRRRKTFGTAKSSERERVGLVPKMHIIDEDPSEDKKIQHHLYTRGLQTMHIMADLSASNSAGTVDDEYVLCTVQVDSRGVISVTPDFNRGRKDYRIESGVQGREMFQYKLEHVSKEMSSVERERENKMYRELYIRHAEFQQNRVGGQFEMPPQDVLRIIINGEIVSARNFEYDDLYIHYFLDLPRNWFAHDGHELSGVTQTCSTTTEGRDEVAYFSFPFSFELFYKNDRINPWNRDLLPSWPTLYCEVLSIDTMRRYRTEGYTYLMVPNTTGHHEEEMHCWRPVGNSLQSEQRRYFIGGSPELEDPGYITVPSSATDQSRISKLGFVTESTGSVKVRLNIIQQSKNFLDTNVSKKSLGNLIDRLGGTATQAGVHQVLEAFRRARERMIAARESLQYLKDLKLDDDTEAAATVENLLKDSTLG